MILIVDDHLDGGAALARLLKQRGHHAIAVSSGPAAMSLLRSTRPRVIVLDHDMPDMTGMDVMRAIRADVRSHDIPVIFYSADTDPYVASEAIRLGAKHFLVKVITPWQEVCETVGRYDRHDAR